MSWWGILIHYPLLSSQLSYLCNFPLCVYPFYFISLSLSFIYKFQVQSSITQHNTPICSCRQDLGSHINRPKRLTFRHIMRTRRRLSYLPTMSCRKRQKTSPDKTSDCFDSLPDDLVLSILCKLSSTATSPSDFISVLITYARTFLNLLKKIKLKKKFFLN